MLGNLSEKFGKRVEEIDSTNSTTISTIHLDQTKQKRVQQDERFAREMDSSSIASEHHRLRSRRRRLATNLLILSPPAHSVSRVWVCELAVARCFDHSTEDCARELILRLGRLVLCLGKRFA